MTSSAPKSKGNSSIGGSKRHQTKYGYQSLNPYKNEIRLLKILPKHPDSGHRSRVKCSLFVASLDSTPEYQALSYSWSDRSERSIHGDILLEGYHFQITPNLENALFQLRSDSVQIFWIDALCINQDNDGERSEQVSKMRVIYQRAENVVVWLGSTSGSIPHAFSLFEMLYDIRLSKKFVAETLKDKTNSKGLQAITELYKKPYWGRVWVIQEVHSARKAIVMCGQYKIDWLKLDTVQSCLRDEHDGAIIRLSSEEPTLNDLSTRIKFGGPKSMQIPRSATSSIPDIDTLLSIFWMKVSSDPRDMVYALVGLTTARDNPRLIVDYSVSVRRVYTDVTKYILVSSQKLDIICWVPRGTNQFRLPSWVPDWTVLPRFGLPILSILGNEGVDYCSAGSTKAEFHLKGNDRILAVKGVLLSPIHFVGLKGTMESEHDFSSGLPIFLNWYKLLNVIQPGKSAEKLEAFCRTVFYDRFSPKDYTYRTPLELMERLLAGIVLLAEEFCPEESIDPYLVSLRKKYVIERWWAKSWMTGACNTSMHRRFFVTKTDLMGMAAQTSEPGDLICILLGCWMPVVLRPKDGHYIYIGEAYVHGYMYGKAMKELAEGKFQLQDLEIH